MSTLDTSVLAGLSAAVTELAQKVSAGVVAVKAAPYRVASGVSLPQSLIAVANHSLRREDRIPVQTASGAEGTAVILGRDPGVDLAILKVEGIELHPLSAVDSSVLKSGTLAAVVGLTIDAGPSTSLGLIGAVGPARRIWRGGMLDQFLRLDVNLYPSQSGAAVVDAAGRLIGLATPALSRHAAVAVPASTLNRIADELLREGRIRHGYLGIGAQPVALPANMSSKVATDARSGLILLSVEPDSPAEKAGLQIGDILVELDGKRTSDIDELHGALRGEAVGKTVKAIILRGGHLETLEILISERPRTGK